MQMDVNKTLYAFYKTHWCKSRQFLGVQKKSCQKLLYYVFIYHVAKDWKMKNLVPDIWFLMNQLSLKTISQITQTTRMVIWRRSET